MGEANIRNLMTPQENQGFRCERTSDWGPASSASKSATFPFFREYALKAAQFRAMCTVELYHGERDRAHFQGHLGHFLCGLRRWYSSTDAPMQFPLTGRIYGNLDQKCVCETCVGGENGGFACIGSWAGAIITGRGYCRTGRRLCLNREGCWINSIFLHFVLDRSMVAAQSEWAKEGTVVR